MAEKKLFLLDGHALVYRAHFAFINRPLINSKGINTSAITGFVRTMWDLMKNQNPTHIAVSFDLKGPTFRHKAFPAYKANREAQPDDIKIALPYIKEIIKGFNIPIVTMEEFEADDVIGTLAKQAEKEGFQVYMVTPDKDYAQLVSENIFMYKPSRSGSGVEILGIPEVLEKFDIQEVDQVIDVLGLQGDSVDNIPGVPGIGAKTASKLLKIYGSVEKLLESTDDLKGKQKENLINFADQARQSKWLATIKLDVPIQFDADTYIIEEVNREALTKIFQELEFRSLAHTILGPGESVQGDLFGGSAPIAKAKRPAGAPAPQEAYQIVDKNLGNVDHTYILMDTDEKYQELLGILKDEKVISFDTETTGINPHEAELVGMVFSIKANEAYYVPTPADQTEAQRIVDLFKPLLEDTSITMIGQNIKYDILMMKWYGCDIQGFYYDTMIGHYLLEPDKRHKLDYLSESYLGYKMVPITDLIGKGKGQLTMRDIAIDKVKEYAGEDADITLQVQKIIFEDLEKQGLIELYKTIEEPLIEVLADMEFTGVRISGEFLNAYSKELEVLIADMEKLVYEKAGSAFNISSPKQVGEILFDRLKIPYRWRKTSSGQYSTDVEKLNELSVENEIVKDILQYRKYSKLKSTYVDALPNLINPKTGRVHSSFNQARAATGRLSSENPNLQNIPIKDEAGRKIRRAFMARDEDHILLAADYSQIELRIIADISKDKGMLEAFINDQDFHKATAAKVYETPFDEVTADQRRNAKTVNFSITYGAGATNLSRQLGIKRGEAQKLIEQYFRQFPGLNNYMNETVESAREKGYVSTLMGRKRTLRDINGKSSLARSNAERMAINTPIQGTAADMIKMAMITIHKEMKDKQYKSKMIMQVHDELVFDVYKPELEEIRLMVDDHMKKAMPGLTVPIKIGMDVGANWMEAH